MIKICADDLLSKEKEIQKRQFSSLYNTVGKNIQNVLPLERKLIVLFDIVGFSKCDTYKQWADIMLFQHYLKSETFRNKFILKQVNVTHFVPTGDGCYLIADECEPETALGFVFSILQGFQCVQPDDEFPMSLRASALLGDVVPFMDLAMHKNYLGEGMNEGSRILTYGQKTLEDDFFERAKKERNGNAPLNEEVKMFSRNSLFLGDSLSAFVKDYVEKSTGLYFYENVPDKHGKTRNITVLQGIKPLEE